MSELPPYIRDPDLSPPPPPEAVEGQAGRPAVSPPLTSALPLSGGGAPPVITAPLAAGGEPAPTAPTALPAPAPAVVNFPPARETQAAPAPAPQGTLTPPTDQALPPPTSGPGGTVTTASPEPAKTQAAPPPKQPAPEDQPLATTPGGAALPTPTVASAPYKGQIPTAGFNWIANKQPEVFNTLATIADRNGITTERLIQHARMESDLNLNVHDGEAGEVGPFQIEPKTQKYLQDKYLRGQQIDAKTWEGGATLAALKIRECDQRGADSYASVACYNGGGDAAKEYAAKFFSDKKSSDHSQLNFGDLDQPNGGSMMSARGVVQAAKQGHDQFQRYIVDTSPRGSSMSDAWQHAQWVLMEHFIGKGDMDGAEKAQNFVIQQAFMGSNMHLMGAQASLARGDGVMAAQQLAKAHAFFPDGTAGRFMTNGRDVFGVRLDEATGKPLGSPFKITAQDIDSQLKFTGNPATFAKFLSEQQKAAADIRYKSAQAGYQEAKPALDLIKEQGRESRFAQGQAGAAERQERQQQYIDRRQAETNLAADRRAAAEKDPQTATQLDTWMKDDRLTEAGWPVPEGVKPEAREKHIADRSALARSLKANSPRMAMTPEAAKLISNSVLTGAFTLAATGNGFAVVDKKTMQPVPGEVFVDTPTGEFLSGKLHPSRRQQQQQGGGAGLAQYATGNAVLGGRSSVEGVTGELSSRVTRMVQDMPPELARRFAIISGHRDAARQAQVNPGVTNSRHMHGKALDLSGDPEVLDWINRNGRRYGVGFPLSRDPKERNHLEMVDPRSGARAAL